MDLELINREGGAYLHRFSWITDDTLIGEIPFEWNFLVEWYPADENEKTAPGAIHYTEGARWLPRLKSDGVSTCVLFCFR